MPMLPRPRRRGLGNLYDVEARRLCKCELLNDVHATPDSDDPVAVRTHLQVINQRKKIGSV
jgi:hypothetical protein